MQKLDAAAVRRQFDRRARRGQGADFVLREIEVRMLDRLDYIRVSPAAILDIGSGSGRGAVELLGRFADAQVYAVDASPAMAAWSARTLVDATRPASLRGTLRRWAARVAGPPPDRRWHCIAAAAERLPLPDASIDLVWSNAMLHWSADVAGVLAECRRVLRPGGLLMLSLFGVDTLRQLRLPGVRLMTFPDMHDVGDALVRGGFADPVVDVDRLAFTYSDPRRLRADLRALGGNALVDRARGLRGRGFDTALQRALENGFSPDDAGRGTAPAGAASLARLDFEVIHAHAWAPAQRALPPGVAPVTVHRRGATRGESR